MNPYVAPFGNPRDLILPAGLKEVYERSCLDVTRLQPGYFVNPDCVACIGTLQAPRAPEGTYHTQLIYEGIGYIAALVGWAITYNEPYPIAWPVFRCKDNRCVNGFHIEPARKGHGGRGRRIIRLQDTVDYYKRYKILHAELSADPYTRSAVLQRALEHAAIGGKTATIQSIILRVRQDLGLPDRVPTSTPLSRDEAEKQGIPWGWGPSQLIGKASNKVLSRRLEALENREKTLAQLEENLKRQEQKLRDFGPSLPDEYYEALEEL